MATHLWSGGAPGSITERSGGFERSSSVERSGGIDQVKISGPRRIAVMGPPGSGKSTMARHLGAHLDLPVFHLDQVYWRPGWLEAPADAFAAEVQRIAARPAWVIDGNFTATIAPRFGAADTVVYLDIPAWLSVLRVIRRMATGYGRVRRDMPQGCPEKLDLRFVLFTARWNRERRTRNLALVEGFAGRKVVLHGRRAVRQAMREWSGRRPGEVPPHDHGLFADDRQ